MISGISPADIYRFWLPGRLLVSKPKHSRGQSIPTEPWSQDHVAAAHRGP